MWTPTSAGRARGGGFLPRVRAASRPSRARYTPTVTINSTAVLCPGEGERVRPLRVQAGLDGRRDDRLPEGLAPSGRLYRDVVGLERLRPLADLEDRLELPIAMFRAGAIFRRFGR